MDSIIYKGHTLTAEWVFVTPEFAKEALTKTKINRNKRKKIVPQYALDMQKDNWLVTGQTAIYDREENLIDGQHRMQAVIDSGTTVLMLIVRGVDPEAQSVIDRGVPRTIPDNLAMAGYKNAKFLAPVVKMAISEQRGYAQWQSPNVAISDREVIDWLKINQDLEDVVALALSHKRPHILCSARGWNYASWLIYKKNGIGVLQQFLEKFSSLVGLYEDDPVKALLDAFPRIRMRGNGDTTRAEVTGIIRAFNERLMGERRKEFRLLTRNHKTAAIPHVLGVGQGIK